LNTYRMRIFSKAMTVITILFVLVYSLNSANTGINIIKNNDVTHAYDALVNIATSEHDLNTPQVVSQISQAESEITNGLYFKAIRELSSVEYAYGEGGYIEQYIVNNNKTAVEKKNFGFHIICGAICLIMGFFQFWPYFRRKFRTMHRVFGSVFIVSGLALCISVLFYLNWSGPETTYEALTGYAGLYVLTGVTLMSMGTSIFYLFKRQYNKHMGWMSITLGSFLTAIFQRYDWLVVAAMDTGQTHAVMNGLVDAILYTQAYVIAYLIFFMNRHYSPLRKNHTPLSRLSSMKKYGMIALSVLGSLSVFHYYVFTQGMADSSVVLSVINEAAFIKETAVIFNQESMLPFMFAVLSSLMMGLGAFLVITPQSLTQGAHYKHSLYSLAGAGLAAIEISWGLNIGYPTMLNSPGGGHYVLWGILHLGFSAAVLYASLTNKQSLLKEWITMLWIMSFFSVTIFWMSGGLSLFDVVPPHYVESRHLSVLLAGGASAVVFLLAMRSAIHGNATAERAIH
jgi:uncharacterized membrane protein